MSGLPTKPSLGRAALAAASLMTALPACGDPPTPAPAQVSATSAAPAASAAPEVKAKAFTAKIVGAEAHVGTEETFEVSVVPAAGYHVNEEYPYKLRLDAPPSGLTYPKEVVTEIARTPQLATMKVPFKATQPGTVRVGGMFSLSVCNPDQCVIEKVALATEVRVVDGPPPAPKSSKLPSMKGVAVPGAIEMTVPDGVVASILPDGARLDGDAFVAKPWIVSFAKGASTSYPAADVEVQGVVIDGSVQLRDETKGGAAPQKLDAWTAFRAPGAAITLASFGDAPVRVVLFVTTADKSPLAKVLPDAKAPPGRRPPPSAAPRKRPIEVVDLQAREALRWSKGTNEARIAWTTPDVPAALDAIVFGPTSAVAEHVHEGAWECLFPLRAAGDVIIDGKPQAVTPGVSTCIPPDVKHAWKPAGTEPLVAVQFYAPAGAEKRFKALAEKESAPPSAAPASSSP